MKFILKGYLKEVKKVKSGERDVLILLISTKRFNQDTKEFRSVFAKAEHETILTGLVGTLISINGYSIQKEQVVVEQGTKTNKHFLTESLNMQEVRQFDKQADLWNKII